MSEARNYFALIVTFAMSVTLQLLQLSDWIEISAGLLSVCNFLFSFVGLQTANMSRTSESRVVTEIEPPRFLNPYFFPHEKFSRHLWYGSA